MPLLYSSSSSPFLLLSRCLLRISFLSYPSPSFPEDSPSKGMCMLQSKVLSNLIILSWFWEENWTVASSCFFFQTDFRFPCTHVLHSFSSCLLASLAVFLFFLSRQSVFILRCRHSSHFPIFSSNPASQSTLERKCNLMTWTRLNSWGNELTNHQRKRHEGYRIKRPRERADWMLTWQGFSLSVVQSLLLFSFFVTANLSSSPTHCKEVQEK